MAIATKHPSFPTCNRERQRFSSTESWPASNGIGKPEDEDLTDEQAVMLHGLNPIHVLHTGEKVEWADYWVSWGAKVHTELEPVR